jgi:hypothetical protein
MELHGDNSSHAQLNYAFINFLVINLIRMCANNIAHLEKLYFLAIFACAYSGSRGLLLIMKKTCLNKCYNEF